MKNIVIKEINGGKNVSTDLYYSMEMQFLSGPSISMLSRRFNNLKSSWGKVTKNIVNKKKYSNSSF